MSGPTVSRAQTPGGDVQIGGSASCVVCNKTDKLLKCSQCRAVFYCTKEHQKRDWKRHKEFCTTHSVRSIVPDTLSTAKKNSMLKIVKDPAVENYQNSSKPVVSNLTERPVPETTGETNAAPETHLNAKYSGGMNKFHLTPIAFSHEMFRYFVFLSVANVSCEVSVVISERVQSEM